MPTLRSYGGPGHPILLPPCCVTIVFFFLSRRAQLCLLLLVFRSCPFLVASDFLRAWLLFTSWYLYRPVHFSFRCLLLFYFYIFWRFCAHYLWNHFSPFVSPVYILASAKRSWVGGDRLLFLGWIALWAVLAFPGVIGFWRAALLIYLCKGRCGGFLLFFPSSNSSWMENNNLCFGGWRWSLHLGSFSVVGPEKEEIESRLHFFYFVSYHWNFLKWSCLFSSYIACCHQLYSPFQFLQSCFPFLIPGYWRCLLLDGQSVRALMSHIDDPDIPAMMIPMWFVGLFFCMTSMFIMIFLVFLMCFWLIALNHCSSLNATSMTLRQPSSFSSPTHLENSHYL